MQTVCDKTTISGDQSGCLREGWGGDIAIGIDRTVIAAGRLT